MIFDAVAYNHFLGPDEDSQFIENKIGSRYKFDSFKMMKSLGSAVEKVHTITEHGYTVKYYHGDVCGQNFFARFNTDVEYVCSPLGETSKPEIISYSQDSCHFKIRWVTVWACPQCKKEQTSTIEGDCDG